MSMKFVELEKPRLDELKNLWEKLNLLHLQDSINFKDHFTKMTFEKRCEKFYGVDDKDLHIISVTDNDVPIGYCISTIVDGTGEIESIFVEEEYRKYGYGKKLVEQAVLWLKKNGCSKIGLSVAAGHESVIGFYEKLGFYPRMIYLELKD